MFGRVFGFYFQFFLLLVSFFLFFSFMDRPRWEIVKILSPVLFTFGCMIHRFIICNIYPIVYQFILYETERWNCLFTTITVLTFYIPFDSKNFSCFTGTTDISNNTCRLIRQHPNHYKGTHYFNPVCINYIIMN